MDRLHREISGSCPSAPAIKHNHFCVSSEPPKRQLLAWRERVGHVIDVLPTRAQVANPFMAKIDRYDIGDRRFTDCSSDTLLLNRPISRISTDQHRDFVFHVFVAGGNQAVDGVSFQHRSLGAPATILALDLNQPIHMLRTTCRVLTLFVPCATVQANLPHAEAIHGRVFESSSLLTHLLVEQVAALGRNIPHMNAAEASLGFDVCVQLLLGAYGTQAGLSGNARAAVRAAMFDKVRRYIQANLYQPTLCAESVLKTLHLPSVALNTMFEQEGGLSSYIRNSRLRKAAAELVKSPKLTISRIAYGLGFQNATDFNKAFHHAYRIEPQELRNLSLQAKRGLADVSLARKAR